MLDYSQWNDKNQDTLNSMDANKPQGSLQLISQAFGNGEAIPGQYTCKGQNINPPLSIMNVPLGAKSLALVMHDPDALGSDFVHWLVWDIKAEAQAFAANSVPVGAVQGVSGFGNNKYGGPCPPAGSGTHRYIFELYALDTVLSLGPDTNREKLEQTMKGHIIEQCSLAGLVADQGY
jgi:Raf kinase inhibitor-like YbhB/YbcL family protein